MKTFLRRLFLIFVFFIVIASFGLISYIAYKSHCPEEHLANMLIEDGVVVKAFFSPDTDLRSILVNLIDCEKRKIVIAIYTITQKNIAHALMAAHRRGIEIECVVDNSYGTDKYSKVGELANSQIPIWVFKSDTFDDGLMHNKFCVFEDNIFNKSIVWTGSYNFTNRANRANQENVIILDNKKVIERYLNQFEVLKSRSIPLNQNFITKKNIAKINYQVPKQLENQLFGFFKKIISCLD